MSAALVDVVTLPTPAQREAAFLVYQSLPAYYDMFGFDQATLAATICEQFHLPGSEVSTGMALYEGTVAGVFFAVTGDRVRGAQLTGLGHLRAFLCEAERPALARRIAIFGASVQPVKACGRYLSRFAVREDRRGSGVADRLLETFLQGVPPGEPATLHVSRDNARAMRFYLRHGFVVTPDSEDFQYVAMQRHA